MKTLTIRGIDPELSQKINEWAKKSGISINQTSLRLLRAALGLTDKKKFPVYNDLDHLAGTWSKKDETHFKENIKELEEIEPELWK